MNQPAHKWLPVVGDACTGCGLCVHACENYCLDLVWDFATLKRPHDCMSDGKCAEACPRDVIQMQWVEAAGNPTIGRWCDRPEHSREDESEKHWLRRLLGSGRAKEVRDPAASPGRTKLP